MSILSVPAGTGPTTSAPARPGAHRRPAGPVAAPPPPGPDPGRRRRWLLDLLLVGVCLGLNSLLPLATGSALTGPVPTIAVGSAAVSLTLFVRRRWPVTVFALHLAWGVAAALLAAWYWPSVGLLAALHTVAARRRGVWLGAALAGCVATAVDLAFRSSSGELPPGTELVLVIAAGVVSVVARRRSTDPVVRRERETVRAAGEAVMTAVDQRFARAFPRLHHYSGRAAAWLEGDPVLVTGSRLRRRALGLLLFVLVFYSDVAYLSETTATGPLPMPMLWVVCVCVAATLLARRRAPVTVLLIQTVWFAALVPLVDEWINLGVGMLAALYALAARRGIGSLLAAVTGCSAVYFWIAYSTVTPTITNSGFAPGLPTDDVMFKILIATFLTTTYVVVVGSVGAIGYRTGVAARRERATVEQALRDERLVIARELHDIVAHSVSIMMLQASGAAAVLETDPRRAAQALRVIGDAGKQALDELRQMLHVLRSATERDVDAATPSRPDYDDVEALIEQSRAAGLRVDLRVEGEPVPLAPSVGLTVYRLVQEALTNTRKHAGTDPHATVRFAWNGNLLHLTVQDDNPHRWRATVPPVPSTGHGLLGLRERVATVGGELRAGPSPAGFLVQASLPVAGRHPD